MHVAGFGISYGKRIRIGRRQAATDSEKFVCQRHSNLIYFEALLGIGWRMNDVET